MFGLILSKMNMQDIAKQLKVDMMRMLPPVMGMPVRMMPFFLQKRVLTPFLLQLFQSALRDDELGFLAGRTIRIEIEDCQLAWTYTYNGQTLEMVNNYPVDANIRSKMKYFLMLANRQIDPDTLFFQRKLIIEGNIELGLNIKNLMDTFDLDCMPAPVTKGLQLMGDILYPDRLNR